MVHVDIAAEKLFAIGPLIVTNSMVGALLASILLLLAARWFTRRSGIVPSRGQSLIELDRKSTRLNSSHVSLSRMPSSA